MDPLLWSTLAAALLISGLVLAYVVWPLLQRGPAPVLLDDDRLSELLARKDTLLQSIKQLEFDHQVGKISDEDFQRFDQQLRRQALGLMQQIEKSAPAGAALDSQLEAEIAQLRRVPEPAQRSAPALLGERASAPTQANGAAQTGAGTQRYCTNCGEPANLTHKFCARCGAPLGQVEGV
jgi:hypothetical protein